MKTNPFEFSRGNTQRGQTGYVAWIDTESRRVNCKPAECRKEGAIIVVVTSDGEQLQVPNGRLDWSPAAALDSLALDVREEGNRKMRLIEEQQAKLEMARGEIARELLLDLVAVELAKAQSTDPEAHKRIGESLARLTQQQDVKAIEQK